VDETIGIFERRRGKKYYHVDSTHQIDAIVICLANPNLFHGGTVPLRPLDDMIVVFVGC